MKRISGAGAVRHRASALFGMARPGFMLGMVPLYAAGVAAALHAGAELDWPGAALGLATVWAVQAMTHYGNEYWDVDVDAGAGQTTVVTGGSGVLVDRAVEPSLARAAAVANLIGAVGLALVTTRVVGSGLPFLLVVGMAIVGGWVYSAPPVRLVGRGLGEVTVAAIAGVLVPTAGYVLQMGTLDATLWRACVPLALVTFGTSVGTAVPDVEGDRRGGKRTLPVRLGRPVGVVLGGLGIIAGWLAFGAFLAPVSPLLGTLALAVILAPVVAYGAAASPTARGSADAASWTAMAAIACQGLTSLAVVAVLVAG